MKISEWENQTLARSLETQERQEAYITKLESLLSDVTETYRKPYAGAKTECLLCGSLYGDIHDESCPHSKFQKMRNEFYNVYV